MDNVRVVVMATVMALVGLGMGVSLPQGPATVAGCYLLDAGSPSDPLPVLVSDSTPDGLCEVTP